MEIVATDLNDNSLVRCRDGNYSDYALRNTTRDWRDKYFEPVEQLFRVKDEIRAMMKFERLNLQDQAKILFMKGFDIIFCCNVLIYFDGTSKRRTVEHFYNALLPGGYFFLGHSESLYGINDRPALGPFSKRHVLLTSRFPASLREKRNEHSHQRTSQRKVSELHNLPAMPSVLRSLTEF